MAAAVIADSGLRRLLAAALVPRRFLRLFRNDVPVLPGTTLLDYQAATFPGYADQEITGTFTTPATDAVARAWSATYNVTWTRGLGGVPEVIYGWIMYEDSAPDSVLITGRRLTVPRTLDSAGQTVIESIIVYFLKG